MSILCSKCYKLRGEGSGSFVGGGDGEDEALGQVYITLLNGGGHRGCLGKDDAS